MSATNRLIQSALQASSEQTIATALEHANEMAIEINKKYARDKKKVS